MKILFATSECAPFSKSGGLADVAFSLPPALKDSGDEVAVITPLYQCVKKKYGDSITYVKDLLVNINDNWIYCGLFRGENNGVTVWFVDNEDMFNRPKLYGYDDDAFRFAFFSKAVITLLPELDFMPQILHCNDWETALVIIYLKNEQTWRPELRGIKTVYTIHNIAYQGQFGSSMLGSCFGLPDGWYAGGLGYEYEGRHDINLMKGAMLMANAVSTVSPTYAGELHNPVFGMGLQGVADQIENKLYGILNGIDMHHYDPQCDPRIVANFSEEDREGKAKCKEYLQETFHMRKEPYWPMLCSVARLNEQKGIELIKQVLPGLMDMGVQLIVFGQGEQKYIDYFNWAKQQWPDQLGFSSDYTEDMAAKIFAGADMYLMPSRFEPCGLSQMMAMRYGTVPIVHETGGLKDSVRPYNDFDGYGDGFSFSGYNAKELYQAILQAVKVYFGQRDVFDEIRGRAMKKDFSWDQSAQRYNRMYSDISDGGDGEPIPFEEAFATLKEAYLELDKRNRKEHAKDLRDDFHEIVEVQITGRGSGVFYMEFEKKGVTIEPYTYNDAHAKIVCSYDNLLGMLQGRVSSDKLFMNGQLRFKGNISSSYDLRKLFVAPEAMEHPYIKGDPTGKGKPKAKAKAKTQSQSKAKAKK